MSEQDAKTHPAENSEAPPETSRLLRPGWHSLAQSPHRLALAIIAVALVVRVGWALASGQLDPFLRQDPLHGDAGSYDRLARNLAAGAGYSIVPPEPDLFWPPLYPAFRAALYRLFPEQLQAARLVHAALGAVSVALVYVLARRLIGAGPALLAALGAALYPYSIYWGNWLIAEALFSPIYLLALFVALRLARRPSRLTAGLLGALIGLAILAKPATLITLALLVGWLALRTWPCLTLRTVAPVLVVLAIAGLVVAPWTIRNYLASGGFALVSVNGGYTFYGANNPDAFGGHAEGFPAAIPGLGPVDQDQQYYRRGLEWIAAHPRQGLGLLPVKLARLYAPLSVASSPEPFDVPAAPLVYALYWAFLACAALGLLLSIERTPDLSLLLVPIAGTTLAAAIFYGDTRYSLPMVPSFLIFAALGLTWLAARSRRLGASRLERDRAAARPGADLPGLGSR